MKPAPFAYAAPVSLDEALGLLGDGAAVLAGGQSLVPELNIRARRPAALVDINRVPGLDAVELTADGLRIGALVRHAALERSDAVRAHCPLLARIVRFVAHPPVRNRGTFGGSIANAHPAAELAAVVAAAGGAVELRSRTATRVVPHDRFVVGPFATLRRTDELVTAVRVPALAGHACGFHEITRREREYAMAGAVVALPRGAVTGARVALFGVEGRPRRLGAAEALLEDAVRDGVDEPALRRAVAGALEADVDGYRRHLAGVAVARAVADALAGGGP